MIYTNQGDRVVTLVVSSATGTTANPTYSSGTPDVIPEMSVSITANGTHVSVQFDGTFELQAGDAFDLALYRDGALLRTRRLSNSSGGTIIVPVRVHAFVPAETPGSHTYDARWTCISGTARAYGVERDLAIVEVPATMLV